MKKKQKYKIKSGHGYDKMYYIRITLLNDPALPLTEVHVFAHWPQHFFLNKRPPPFPSFKQGCQ